MAANPTIHESIIVKSIEMRTSESGQKYALISGANGKRYSCWDSATYLQMGEGVVVYAEVASQERNGRMFYNIKGISPTLPTISAPAPTVPPSGDLRDVNIRRQVALKCAVDLYSSLHLAIPPDATSLPTGILALADRFVAWLDPSHADSEIPF